MKLGQNPADVERPAPAGLPACPGFGLCSAAAAAGGSAAGISRSSSTADINPPEGRGGRNTLMPSRCPKSQCREAMAVPGALPRRCGIGRFRTILKMLLQYRMQLSEIIEDISSHHPESEGEELCFPAWKMDTLRFPPGWNRLRTWLEQQQTAPAALKIRAVRRQGFTAAIRRDNRCVGGAGFSPSCRCRGRTASSAGLSFGHQDARAMPGCGKKPAGGDPSDGAGVPAAPPAPPSDSLIAPEIVPPLARAQESNIFCCYF
ncbi:uncharacterized protein LOC128916972 isoform X2 [Rissa tridactyla]|uniref:uncharacterized protein LOC128916972 isoform X2 n=1 Tax=Rissa tridactyla TaxID=75485 RepID=UPI0023BAA67C|nr:uncharacterized protein LOC128916972 isoform X2 [Rissa tridactyla]